LVEGGERQAGHGPEDRRVLTESLAAQDHDNLKGSCQKVRLQLSLD
jgi:hypothetical protein